MKEEFNLYLKEIDIEVAKRESDFSNITEAFSDFVLSEFGELMGVDEYSLTHGIYKDSGGNIRGELHGYALSSNGEVLTLFYTYYDGSMGNEVQTLLAKDYQQAMNRLQGFYDKAIRGMYFDIAEGDPLYEPAKLIYNIKNEINTVRLCILSNYSINGNELKKVRITDKDAYPDVWDIKRLYQFHTDGNDHVPIDIDFEGNFKWYRIPYIEMNSKENHYKCILTMFPAKLLYNLYQEHNTGLLLNNIRYFLGFKGSKKNNANIGILKTLREESHCFLAYNNGITALAASVDVESDGRRTDVENVQSIQRDTNDYINYGILKCIHDFRIVNGGQTTASIFNAKHNNGADISLLGVYVQVKIVVINDEVRDMAENITRYSNTQSKIKYSDFTVSNTYNMEMERLSRATIIPSLVNATTKHWYFERLRGQYDQEKKKNSSSRVARDYFSSNFPADKKFKKELIAKVWQSWDQVPFDAVKGEATNYELFMTKIQKANFIPNEVYYRQTIALIIIYNYLMESPFANQWKNKKATIVAYTLALLRYLSFDKIDLIKIWNRQAPSDNTKAYLNSLSAQVESSLTALAEKEETSVLSVGKKKSTYDEVRDQGFRLNGEHIMPRRYPWLAVRKARSGHIPPREETRKKAHIHSYE